MTTATVTTKGQITIQATVREARVEALTANAPKRQTALEHASAVSTAISHAPPRRSTPRSMDRDAIKVTTDVQALSGKLYPWEKRADAKESVPWAMPPALLRQRSRRASSR